MPEPQPSPGLINHVNGLVGQEAVGNVPLGHVHSRLQCILCVNATMMLLIFPCQASQNLHALLFTGLRDVHRLEPPLQSRILFDILAILFKGGGADQLQCSSGHGRFQQIGSICTALHPPGAHQRVDLVDDQHNVLVLLHFTQNVPQPLLKLSAVLRACHQHAHVQLYDLLVRQGLWHFTQHNPKGNAFGDGRLPDARLPDKDGVVLAAAPKNLGDALHLLVPPNQGIQLSGPGQFGDVGTEVLEGGASLVP
mmetsp:Transcript_72869/g.122718  ORF Transcript_72869/g.122718 Transcript_72869/m.122718 type:complete len:252 (+) Transcript_72869:1442-2197(+)